jgi:hypothetical protein
MQQRPASPRPAPFATAVLALALAHSGVTAAPTAAEVVTAPGYALTVNGPYELTPQRLREIVAAPSTFLPGESEDFQARQARRKPRQPQADGALAVLPAAPHGAPEGQPLSPSGELTQTPAAVTSFRGLLSTGDWAADTQVAASHTHVVVTTRTTIGFFNKAGQQLMRISARDFFGPARLDLIGNNGGLTNFFDNRLIFDSYRNRFWLAALVYDTNLVDTNLTKFVVAVSRTLDPRDGWWIYWWDAVPGDGRPGTRGNVPGDSADYPLLGVDSRHFFQTNMVADNTPYPRPAFHHRTQQISFVDAAALASGRAATGWQWYQLPAATATILQPAVHHGPAPRAFFVNTIDANRIAVWAASNPLLPSRKLERAYVQVRPFAWPVDAPQKDGDASRILMTNLGSSPAKATWRGGKLYLSFNDAANWFGDGNLTSSRFLRLGVAGWPATPSVEVDRTFGGNSAFYDSTTARVHYGFPTVAVNKLGDAVLVYARSGTTLYPEVSFSVYPAAGPDIQPSRRLKQGEAPFRLGAETLLQLHDLNGASVDPHDDTAVWVAAPYAVSPGALPPAFAPNVNFAVWVGKVFGVRTPDLTVPAIAFAPAQITRGPLMRRLKVTTSIHNQGDGNAGPSRITLWLRRTSSTTRVKLGDVRAIAVASGKTMKVIAEFPLPAAIGPGVYVIEADADSANAVAEYSGVNNRGSSFNLLRVF